MPGQARMSRQIHCYSAVLAVITFALAALLSDTVQADNESPLFSQIKMNSHRIKRIIGGQEITSGQFPWLVNIRAHIPTQMVSYFAVKYSDIYCAGSIINKRWIVTAAHCFAVPGLATSDLLNVKNWYVKAGDVQLSYSFGQRLCAIWNAIRKVHNAHCWYFGVDKIILHPQFNLEDNWFNDIALIKLSGDLPLAPSDPTIDAIPLPDPANSTTLPQLGTQCTIQGWGCTSNGGTIQAVARSVSMPIVQDTDCSGIIQPAIGPTRVCAGYKDNNTGLCKGDSGGGLVCKVRPSSGWTLVGIASATSLTNPGSTPGVFTRVSAYLSWINTTVTAN